MPSIVLVDVTMRNVYFRCCNTDQSACLPFTAQKFVDASNFSGFCW